MGLSIMYKSVSEIENDYNCKIDDIFKVMKDKDISLADAMKELNLESKNKTKAKEYEYNGKMYTAKEIVEKFIPVIINERVLNGNIEIELYSSEKGRNILLDKRKERKAARLRSLSKKYSISKCITILRDDLEYNNDIGCFRDLCLRHSINYTNALKEFNKTENWQNSLKNNSMY